MSDKKTSSSSVFPFLPILALIFITLKLTGYIAWSWWWVLSPIWIPIGLLALIVLIWFLVAMIGGK